MIATLAPDEAGVFYPYFSTCADARFVILLALLYWRYEYMGRLAEHAAKLTLIVFLMLTTSYVACASTPKQRAEERNRELQRQYEAQRYKQYKYQRTHPMERRGTVPPGLSQILTRTFDYHSNVPSMIDVKLLTDGCDQRDCVTAIDLPHFDSVVNTSYLQEGDLLIVVEYQGEIRAYPHTVLNIHEVVNDRFGDTPVLVSYCPLTGAGTAFYAQVNGLPAEFGVSGMLYNSSRVLYDRSNNNLWDQISGEALVGKFAGQVLTPLPVRTLTWSQLKQYYPKARVLQVEVNQMAKLRDVTNQFANYRQSERIYFPVANKDRTQHPKMMVYGIYHNGQSLAISESYLQQKPVVERDFNGDMVRIQRNRDGSIQAILKQTKQPLAVTQLYWFAWYNTHTETDLLIPRSP
ncbi:DUF3179 domain-containing (seleno)protein [Porticoccaceae bacterium LTM1]|nr:DUF3179 domain-containing (seleno)protein [Porticoccaceae bacterium LTM1]